MGLHRIAAVDAYNGTLLWSLEVPGFERFNMPRDSGNWCADDRFLFITVRDKRWQIDAATGTIVRYHQADKTGKKTQDWGYVARAGDKLLGTAVKPGTAYTSFWGKGDAGWYDAISGAVTFKVASEQMFARNVKTGEVDWQYRNGVVLNSTITATADRVFLLECRHPKIVGSASRRIGSPELWKNLHLVALDLKTGTPLWEKKLNDIDGSVSVSMAHSGNRLVITASARKNYDVTAYDAANGKRTWRQRFSWPGGKSDHGKAISRPAIVNGRVFVRPRMLDLKTGRVLPNAIPAGGCGTYACTSNAMIYRSGSGGKLTLWDFKGKTTTNWARLRPGYWLSTIPAGGMLLSPEAGGGCSCGKWIESSFGFAPR